MHPALFEATVRRIKDAAERGMERVLPQEGLVPLAYRQSLIMPTAEGLASLLASKSELSRRFGNNGLCWVAPPYRHHGHWAATVGYFHVSGPVA